MALRIGASKVGFAGGGARRSLQCCSRGFLQNEKLRRLWRYYDALRLVSDPRLLLWLLCLCRKPRCSRLKGLYPRDF